MTDLPTQIYREVHILSYPNGTISFKEVWRGRKEDYKAPPLMENSFRVFEVYLYGRGWVQVDRPVWATSIGQTNPSQEEFE